jgi:Cof subfamily protein (haloacid dehalogenase superfamily)
MRYLLAAIDIDDTLIGHDGTISVANAEAIDRLRAAGTRVVLASGRSHANMLPFHAALQLPAGPLVSAQGAVVRDAESGDVWHAHAMTSEDVVTVTEAGRALGFAVQHYRLDGIYVDARTRWTDYDQSRNAQPQRLVADLLAPVATDVVKVIWLGEPAAIARAARAVPERFADRLVITPTDPEYLEFARGDVSKAAGLAVVAERFGIARERVVAFGDGNNDVAMLQWAGLGVAMPHAQPAALRAANVVAPAGDPETALARAIALVLDVGAEAAA